MCQMFVCWPPSLNKSIFHQYCRMQLSAAFPICCKHQTPRRPKGIVGSSLQEGVTQGHGSQSVDGFTPWLERESWNCAQTNDILQFMSGIELAHPGSSTHVVASSSIYVPWPCCGCNHKQAYWDSPQQFWRKVLYPFVVKINRMWNRQWE